MIERQMMLYLKLLVYMSSYDFVGAYEIMLNEILSRSVCFWVGDGVTRCAQTLGEYALGPLSDLLIIRDYALTPIPLEKRLERGSKLLGGAAGKGVAELVRMWEKELKDEISKVMSENKTIFTWMEKYLLGDDNLGNFTQNFYYFEPTQNRYYGIKIIITLISRSRMGKFFKNIHPKKLYAGFKRRRQKKLLKNKEMLESLYAM